VPRHTSFPGIPAFRQKPSIVDFLPKSIPSEFQEASTAFGSNIFTLPGQTVGFFSSLLNIGKRVLSVFTGTPAAAATRAIVPSASVQQIGVAATRAGAIGRVGRAGAGLVAGGAAFGLGQSIFDDGGGDGGQLAAMGGNGDSFRRTIVQTIRASDGVITRQEILRGGPHLMQHDLVVAKRVFRLASKLHAKMPRRTVRVSRQKMLMQQVVENALEQKMCPPLPCPPAR